MDLPGVGKARTASWLVLASGTKPCNIVLDNKVYTRLMQANSFVRFAPNANPNRAGNPGATEAAVVSRILG